MDESWRVRRAATADSDAIRTVAATAWRDTYAGLLRQETIERFITSAYSLERVDTRVREDEFFVVDGDEGIVAFADAVSQEDHVELQAIYALPELRGRGAGTALLTTIVELFPEQPISADVVVGNRKGETFYERKGFVPGERLEAELFDEPVVERRWWRPAAFQPAGPKVARPAGR
jgi:GNAT superfamily N-acetyltransferase